jgi:hypothetical protein
MEGEMGKEPALKPYRLFLSAALIGLSACSLVAKIRGKTGPDAPSASGMSPVTADAKDSPAVKNKLSELGALEKLFAEKRWKDYAHESTQLHSYFMFQKGLEGEPKREKIMQRLGALDASAYQMFPRLQVLLGSGARVVEGGIDKQALEPLVMVLDACDETKDIRSKDALAKTLATYEKALARVKKVDKNAFRYFGDTNSRYSSEDIPSVLLTCEGNLAAAASGFEEEYVAETAPADQVETGCGMAVFLADGIRVGPNKFAPYTRTEGGAAYPERIDCKKLKRKNKFGGAFGAAVKDYAAYIEIGKSDLVVVAEGKPYVEEASSDEYLHRFQKLVAYSKKFRFATNPCGAKSLFCEAGGSQSAMAFNRMEHALDRAEIHAGSKPELCRAHLKDAKSRADWFAEFYEEATKDKSWIAGATYKTKKGKKLKEAAFVSAFKEQGELADDRLLGKYCDAPAMKAMKKK